MRSPGALVCLNKKSAEGLLMRSPGTLSILELPKLAHRDVVVVVRGSLFQIQLLRDLCRVTAYLVPRSLVWCLIECCSGSLLRLAWLQCSLTLVEVLRRWCRRRHHLGSEQTVPGKCRWQERLKRGFCQNGNKTT